MTKDPEHLRALLRQLHDELVRTPRLDPSGRALLITLAQDIQAVLGAEEAKSALPPALAPHGIALEDAAVRFEAEHPTLARAARELAEALARVGM